MMSQRFGKHLVPVVLALFCGIVCLYWYFKFESRIPAAAARVEKLQDGLRTLECPALNKEVVFAIALESVEQDRRFAELYLIISMVFFGIATASYAFGSPSKRTSIGPP